MPVSKTKSFLHLSDTSNPSPLLFRTMSFHLFKSNSSSPVNGAGSDAGTPRSSKLLPNALHDAVTVEVRFAAAWMMCGSPCDSMRADGSLQSQVVVGVLLPIGDVQSPKCVCVARLVTPALLVFLFCRPQFENGDKLSVLRPREFADIRSQLNVDVHALARSLDPEKLETGEISAKFSEVRLLS